VLVSLATASIGSGGGKLPDEDRLPVASFFRTKI